MKRLTVTEGLGVDLSLGVDIGEAVPHVTDTQLEAALAGLWGSAVSS